jgi:hypothetical protein
VRRLGVHVEQIERSAMVGVAKMRKGERRIVLVEGVAGGCGGC